MKKICLLLCSFYFQFINAQNTDTHLYLDDLNSLKKILLHKNTFFNTYPKHKFIKDMDSLKKSISKGNTTFFDLKIQSVLSKFKEYNLKIIRKNKDSFPFQIKEFNNKFYLIKIFKPYNYLLKKELQAINNIPISEIKKRIKKIYYLPNNVLTNKKTAKILNDKKLLSYINVTKKDSVNFTFLLENQIKHTVYLKKTDSILSENISEIEIKNKPFSKKYSKKWFWTYGINFGKQVYYKHRVLLSKDFFNSVKDSLNISDLKLAKKYAVSLQELYDSPNYNPVLNKIKTKFKKKRYKKLIIDFRNNTKGTSFYLKKMIELINSIKRLRKKERLYILVNQQTNNASLKYVLELSKKFKPIIIGNTCVGTIENSDYISVLQLKNTKLNITIPKKHQKLHQILLDKQVTPSINHFINGIDLYLEKALN